MPKKLLESSIKLLEENNDLIHIKDEVDPNLQMASIHLESFKNNNKAIFFHNIKGTKYRSVSNLFGNIERSKKLFNNRLNDIKDLIKLKSNPLLFFRKPFSLIRLIFKSFLAIPKRVSFPSNFEEIEIEDLPQIKCWPMDGGSFITLPQVYSEDIDSPGIMNSNLGMYRIQLLGNEYKKNKEIGLHYQIHRGIGIHHTKTHKQGLPLKVSIFVGGHPGHIFAAIMPLPEGISELSLAGVLSGRRFRYCVKDGYTISTDADFVICGEVYPNELKPEGPFGDHLGYYSLKHDFPVLRVHKVYAKEDGIWPFTVVGRPPQEDSQFGAIIHEITDNVLTKEIPGLHSLNAVDAAGVHPLLLAIGSERYTPFYDSRIPQELLTIANHILGTGQMSLAKYLCIIDNEDAPNVRDEKAFFTHLFERADWSRDLHFQTKTTIDTLDYTGEKLNQGSKVVIAVSKYQKRKLVETVPKLNLPDNFSNPQLISAGNLIIQGAGKIENLISFLENQYLEGVAMVTLVDDVDFIGENFSNWLWVTFTRSNPASDIYGLHSETKEKHFSCSIPVIDARIKLYHAPILER